MVDTTLNRRDFVKGASAMALAGAALSSAATALAGEAGPMTPGIYTATAPGYHGTTTVYVTVSEDAILDVAVSECTDEPVYYTKHAVEQMPKRIVEAQSTSVDVVAGVTFTSFSIMSAVEACLEQAGGKGLFSAAPEKPEKTQGETVETDVLVIGGGIAGLSAAYAAKHVNLNEGDSGLKVTLLEKLAFVGGSTPLAVGGLFTASPVNGTPSQALIDSQIERMTYANGDESLNVELLTNLMNVAGDTVYRLRGMGMPLSLEGTPDDAQKDSVGMGFNTDTFVSSSYGADYPGWGAGCTFVESYRVWLNRDGVDVRLNTSATNLIIEDGVVVGAYVEGPESVYEIRAKKVILACGGMAQNREMIEQYAPADANSLVWCNGGADGDGIRMGVEAGGMTVGDRLYGYPMVDNLHGIHANYGSPTNTNGFLVNKNGELFASNGKTCAAAYYGIADQPDGVAFGICDANYSQAAGYEAGLASGECAAYVFKGETLEELAEVCGIDPAGLLATVEAFNKHLEERGEVTGGFAQSDLFENPEFPFATPIATGPFYACKVIQVHLGSLVGLVVDGTCKVLDANGAPIENLYATGECILGGNIFTIHCGGWGIGTGFYSGRIAAEDAQAAILA